MAAGLLACAAAASGDLAPSLEDIGTNRPLAPPDSGSSDAADAGSLPNSDKVTVVVTDFTGAKRRNVSVFFHDANGAVVETTRTNKDGTAASSVTPVPSMATVLLDRDGLIKNLLTWTEVRAGDVLPVVEPTETTGNVAVTMPPRYTPDAGTASTELWIGGCRFTHYAPPGELVPIQVHGGCYRGADAALGVAKAARIVAFAPLKNVTIPFGGSTSIALDAWVPATPVRVSISKATGILTQSRFEQIANETFFEQLGTVLENEVEYAALPGAFADAYQATLSIVGDDTTEWHRVLGRRVPAATTSIAFDVNDLPPPIQAKMAASTSFTRPAAEWSGDVSGMKGGLVRFGWRDWTHDHWTYWSIVVPPHAGSTGLVRAPELPSEYAYVVPTEHDGTREAELPDVYFVDSDLVADYAAWRALQGTILPDSVLREGARKVDRAILPANGYLKITSYHPPFW